MKLIPRNGQAKTIYSTGKNDILSEICDYLIVNGDILIYALNNGEVYITRIE